MNNYGQFIDIESGLSINNAKYLYDTNYSANIHLTRNDHIFVDINESSIEEFNESHGSIHVFPLAVTYFWFFIRRMMNV